MISIIIPAYNVEEFIEECFQSILSQTIKDFEVIIVDDGSSDGTLEIVKSYCANDPRFQYLSQENSGQSAARNKGLDVARGEYVVFVDSDDWLTDEHCLEKLLNAIETTGADFVQASMEFTDLKDSHKYLIHNSSPIEGDQILEDMLSVNNLSTSPCAKIYSTDFFNQNNLRFIEGQVNEDTAFSICMAAQARRVAFIEDVVYTIRERPESTSRAKSYVRMLKTMHTVMNITRSYLQDNGKMSERIAPIFEARYLRSMLYNLLQAAQRVDYQQFRRDWDFCMAETDYRAKSTYAKHLPAAHRAMYRLSMHPRAFYHSFRFLNKLGIKMH